MTFDTHNSQRGKSSTTHTDACTQPRQAPAREPTREEET